MRKVINSLIIGSLLIICGCRKTISSAPEATSFPGDNYPDLFQAFWNGMNTNYVFWGLDTTNWDNMYKVYKPLFDQLSIFDSSDEAKAEQYFEQMTQGLIDSHYTLQFMLTGGGFSPAQYRKLLQDPNYFADSSFPAAVLDSLIPAKYISHGSLVMGTDTVYQEGTYQPFTAVSGMVNGNILYLYFSSFALSQAGNNTTPVFEYFFRQLRNLQNIKGIVIDVRGNGGGEVEDLDLIVGQMVTSEYTFGYTRYKNGVNRLDYSPWAPAVVKPWFGGSVNVTAPIVVLADHLSVSMAEITTMAIKTLPNGKFIGTRTWGANGPLASSVYLDGGQFTIGSAAFGSSGYMFVYTSSSEFKYLNGDIYEGVGVPPDIYARETYGAYLSGDDLVLDAAIKYIGQ